MGNSVLLNFFKNEALLGSFYGIILLVDLLFIQRSKVSAFLLEFTVNPILPDIEFDDTHRITATFFKKLRVLLSKINDNFCKSGVKKIILIEIERNQIKPVQGNALREYAFF